MKKISQNRLIIRPNDNVEIKELSGGIVNWIIKQRDKVRREMNKCEYCQEEISDVAPEVGCARNSCILKRLVETEKVITKLMNMVEELIKNKEN